MKNRVLFLSLFLPAVAAAATYYVPGDYSTIQQAINACVDGDSVIVTGIHEGPFTFGGKNIVVKGLGATVWTYIDSSCFYFTNGETRDAILEGFILSGEWFTDLREGRDPDNGGGVYVENASPTIQNCTFDRCDVVVRGGGLYCDGGSPLIQGNVFQYCEGGGGGMYLTGVGTPTQPAEVIENAICWNQNIGIWCDFGPNYISILGNHIYQNDGGNGAGGVDLEDCHGLVAGNLIEGNTGSVGGISFNGTCSLTVHNNVVAGNEGSEGAGGIEFLNNCTCPFFSNNTVCGNSTTQFSAEGGGMTATMDTLVIRNSIFTGNFAQVGPQLALWGYVEIEYCDIEDGIDSIYVWSGGTLIWGPGNIDEDPLFESGPLSDYHLSAGSPCIDAGNPDPAYNDPEDPMNPGYALWPALGGVRNDMGAYGGSGVGYWVGIEEEAEPPPASDELTLRVFPNPFRGSATLVFELAQPGQADLKVYDLSGRLVEELFSGNVPSGPMSCWLDGSQLPTGVYLARLQAGGQSATIRLVKL